MFSSMPISESSPSETNRQPGVTKNEVWVCRPSSKTTRSTITMGSRCGIRVVMGASATVCSQLIDDNGSHFSSGNHEVGHLHFASHHGHAHHFLEDRYGGPEFLSGTGARKYFHVFNRPDIPDRRRQASEEVIITLVQGDGLGKVLDNPRFRQVARRVGQ